MIILLHKGDETLCAMRMDTEKALNLANTILGIGILLLIVPVGFAIVTLSTLSNEGAIESLASLGWICFMVISIVPVGMGAFVGGLTWMVYLKRRAKLEDIDADDIEE